MAIINLKRTDCISTVFIMLVIWVQASSYKGNIRLSDSGSVKHLICGTIQSLLFSHN